MTTARGERSAPARAALGTSLVAAIAFAPVAGAQTVPAVLPRGVDAAAYVAMRSGLEFLARSQGRDGSWIEAAAGGAYPTAMTGLAGMALIASGSTPTRGPHWQAVRRAVDWLLSVADPDSGLVADLVREDRPMYGHGFATLFLASVYGMEEDLARQERLHAVLSRAVRLIERAQSSAGGWDYTPDSRADEGSVTVTQVQALRACRMAGIVVDKRTVDRAVAYIGRCQNADGGICYRFGRPGPSCPAISAAGVAVLYGAGVYDDQPFVDRALRYVQRVIRPTTDTTGHHFYSQMYFAQVLYQRGGADWDGYYAQIAPWLARQQRRDGSWVGDEVGPTYGTAVALLILQLPYALAPIYQR